jgi:DNA anti-recombination protein RmuC
MPQAKRSTSTRVGSKFKQPAALKRLTTSLDAAQKALGELSKGSGREVSKGAKDIYADLRKFVSDAGKESTKVGKALQREFDQAQKQLSKASRSSASGRSTSSRGAAKASTAKPSTAKRSTASRSTTSRSTTSRSASSRSASGRSTTRRASSGTAKRSTGGATRRGTSKS